MRSAVIKKIRVVAKEAAFIYGVFEANEGVTAYTTLPHQAGALYRDIELTIPPDQIEELNEILKELSQSIEIIELKGE
tara:strand:- start:6114 stop:6347 length:234 start_codon:yes stop_codon:yes gene_type:complete